MPHRLSSRVAARRRGAIVVLSALLLIVLVAVAAFAVEISMTMKVQSELQRSADAAALAGCWEYAARIGRGDDYASAMQAARQKAQLVAADNVCGTLNPELDANVSNLADGGIIFGRFDGFGDYHSSFTPDATQAANALSVTVRRTDAENGALPLIFGRLLGVRQIELEATGVAAFAREIRGFRQPSNDTIPLMPFAVDKEVWEQALQGFGDDDYRWNADTGEFEAGFDGLVEFSMYPSKTGAPGNFGTVDIGAGQGTNELRRKIVEGLNASDLEAMGGKIELNEMGELILSGDTGVSAGMDSALEEVIGAPKVMMIYSQVAGQGTGSEFTIVKFVGVRVIDCDFSGSNKTVLVQPTGVSPKFGIVGPSSEDTSDFIQVPVILVK